MCLVTQSCPTLCDPMDCSAPGSPVCGILHARILDWVAIYFSRGSSWLRSPALQANSLPSEPPGLTWFKMIIKVFYNAFLKSYNTLFSPPLGSLKILSDIQNVQVFVTQWTVVHQAPLSVEFFTQEYWSGLPFTSLGDLLDSGLLHCRWILYWVSH